MRPAEASAKEGKSFMYYVYQLKSITHPTETYIGFTENLKIRLQQHNNGSSPYTSKFKPWKITSYHAFESKLKAEAFEKYFKTGSGRAFILKHL
jgi:putative endonuclease